MLAYLRSPAFLASALLALVGADARPRHSLHVLLMRSCSHICDPSHSLHLLFWRLYSHLPEGILQRALHKTRPLLLADSLVFFTGRLVLVARSSRTESRSSRRVASYPLKLDPKGAASEAQVTLSGKQSLPCSPTLASRAQASVLATSVSVPSKDKMEVNSFLMRRPGASRNVTARCPLPAERISAPQYS